VKVLSLGKENGVSKLGYIGRFYKYIWQERRSYDAVFVHMNPEYAVLGGILWRVWGKRLTLWYVHRQTNLKLWLAEKFSHIVFTSAPESFKLKTNKVKFVGHGINTDVFNTRPRTENHTLMHVGRITHIKHCEVLIDAMEHLGDGWSAEFIGPAITLEDKKYKETLLKNKNVEFLDSLNQEAIAAKFSEAFASVNLAPTGGMDKAVLESWASGCPAFTSNETFREFLGEFADMFLFKFRDAEDLSNKVKIFENLPNKTEIVWHLSEKVKREYSVENLISKVANYIEQ
jgi:glycosyltransferase involved in cell wall biosynthesis